MMNELRRMSGNFGHVNSPVLDENQLRRIAPAAFAVAKHERTSDAYSFVPTVAVLSALGSEGWQPVWASQSRTRDVTRYGTTKHMIRLRHRDAGALLRSPQVGDLFPEVVLVNSHDGACSYQLHAGIFRMVCGNGMIVADSTFSCIRLKHIGFDPRQAVEAAWTVAKDVPRIGESIEAMRAVNLTYPEQVAFAESATIARWDSVQDAPVKPEHLLTTRRSEDRQSDLWTTLNRVQENVIRGGIRGRAQTGRRYTTRPIQSVSEDTRMNKALWHLAESMRAAKAA
jgi:hypothetical protein